MNTAIGKYSLRALVSSGHTFRFCWTVQDLELFLVLSNSPLAMKGIIINNNNSTHSSISMEWLFFCWNLNNISASDIARQAAKPRVAD